MTPVRFVAVFGLLMGVSACAGGNAIDQGVPQAAFETPTQPSGAPRNTGTFPDFNAEPPRSQKQFTDAERAALMAEMQALQQQQEAAGISTAESRARLRYLRQLAASHSDEALEKIEQGPQ